MLECVVNVSEGRDRAAIDAIAAAAGRDLLDLHTDPHHHRSVLTLVGRGGTAARRHRGDRAARPVRARGRPPAAGGGRRRPVRAARRLHDGRRLGGPASLRRVARRCARRAVLPLRPRALAARGPPSTRSSTSRPTSDPIAPTPPPGRRASGARAAARRLQRVAHRHVTRSRPHDRRGDPSTGAAGAGTAGRRRRPGVDEPGRAPRPRTRGRRTTSSTQQVTAAGGSIARRELVGLRARPRCSTRSSLIAGPSSTWRPSGPSRRAWRRADASDRA